MTDRQDRRAATFAYPVALLVFNRPDELARVLASLGGQDLPIDARRAIVHVDAYAGSLDEVLGRPDRTADVSRLVAEWLPTATVIRPRTNVGIARAFDAVERAAFADPQAAWAAFFEDDLELGPGHLRTLEWMIREAEGFEDVVCLSASGDSDVPHTRGEDTYYPMHYAWSHALRRAHWTERRPILDAYLDALGDAQYSARDEVAVYEALAKAGVFPVASNQDAVNEAARLALGRVALTTGVHAGTYIGAEGETWRTANFERAGFAQRRQADPRSVWQVPITEDVISLVRQEAVASYAARATENLVASRERERARIERQAERIRRQAERIDTLKARLDERLTAPAGWRRRLRRRPDPST